jgi:ATPase subunit of ABC transporter with duplicated ATPase domains
MLIAQSISYTHPNKDLLFSRINLALSDHDKVALIGNNGTGKSTLLKIIAGELQPSEGQLHINIEPYYVPQLLGQYDHLSIAEALGIADKLNALNEILNGNATEKNFNLLDDDWTIEDRCNEALGHWHLSDLKLTQKMATLSGGQKTKVFLAGISIHQPKLILLDEPSNHLDVSARQLLYEFIQSTSIALIVVSHDRKLLNLRNKIYELSNRGITIYGGDYDFYAEQKQVKNNALSQDIESKEKALRKAREKERETVERQQKLDARGKNKQEKAGVARIMMNTLRNNAENSMAKVKSVHAEKIGDISQELQALRSALPDVDQMKFGLDNSLLHKGKVLSNAVSANFSYDAQFVWEQDLNFEIRSRERIALKGTNGSGKTTLIKLILGTLQPTKGTVKAVGGRSVYIDQEYSLIDNQLKVYEQAQKFNSSALQEHEIKIRLNRFLFTKAYWDKPCSVLSGGERMRLMLCCLTINQTAPDMIILDEPTNNVDIQNIEILTAAINQYQGTLIVVSHDDYFLKEINTDRIIDL